MSGKPFSIFVVEDNEWYNKLLVHNLSLNPDFSVKSFTTGKALLAALHESPNAITLDYRLPDTDGETLLRSIKETNPAIEVVVISEQGDIETAVELLKAGAADYLVKSKDIKDRLHSTMNHLRKQAGLQQQVADLKQEVQSKYDFERSIIGNSPAMKKVFAMVEKAISTNITVTIEGETGTGKEVIAKAIHYNSPRKNKPFVAVNMAAIPAELIESELFGHERGAFTGAVARRKGKFEEATGGTLFLDEIGELDISFQAKLLRALQEKEITRIGNNQPVKIDCRIVVATNRNLQEEVKAGNFREDLYFRLFGLPIQLPPLRDRGNDVLLLATHFMADFAKENNVPEKPLADSARQKLLNYRWAGNVRELKSVVELAMVMAAGDTIEANDITVAGSDMLPDVMAEEASLREYNRRIVQLYMDRCDNDTKQVADLLDIGQTTVYRLLKESREAEK